jgi:hypothetical protein
MELAYRRVREARAKAKSEYLDRLRAVGLSALGDEHYSGTSLNERPYGPHTEESWQLHRELLARENALTPDAKDQIEAHLRAIHVSQRAAAILEGLPEGSSIPSAIPSHEPVTKTDLRTIAGHDELRLIAMQQLGLQSAPEYGPLYAEVSRQKHFGARSLQTLFADRPME